MIVIGIDIGNRGAIAILVVGGELITVYDMPVLRDGPAGRPAVNGPLLAEVTANSHATMASVQYVGARPTDGPTGAFTFGRSRGLVEGVCAALGLPMGFLTPPVWKRIIGIAPGKAGAKDAARSEAIRRWPSRAPSSPASKTTDEQKPR